MEPLGDILKKDCDHLTHEFFTAQPVESVECGFVKKGLLRHTRFLFSSFLAWYREWQGNRPDLQKDRRVQPGAPSRPARPGCLVSFKMPRILTTRSSRLNGFAI